MAPAFEFKKSKSSNIKFQLKRALVLTMIFSILFSTSYYVVNMLDIKPKVPSSSLVAASSSNLKAGDKQLSDKLGAREASLAGFSDWAKINDLSGIDIYNDDADKDGLENYLEYIHGTDPNNADTDGDKYSDMKEITNGYDPDAYGDVMTKVSIKIDKIGVNAPMVWSKTDVEANMLKDLENGLSHFVGTASPGQKGNAIVSGHSSNYIWAKGDYNYIFKDLGNVEKGDFVTVSTIQKNGRIINYKYKVNDKYVAAPDEERIFASADQPVLTLSTCWPIGTNLKRIIVKAELLRS